MIVSSLILLSEDKDMILYSKFAGIPLPTSNLFCNISIFLLVDVNVIIKFVVEVCVVSPSDILTVLIMYLIHNTEHTITINDNILIINSFFVFIPYTIKFYNILPQEYIKEIGKSYNIVLMEIE